MGVALVTALDVVLVKWETEQRERKAFVNWMTHTQDERDVKVGTLFT